MKKILSAISVLFCIIFLTCGCDKIIKEVTAPPPPISVTFRSSAGLWGGKVMQVTNRSSDETLVMSLYVENTRLNQCKSYTFIVKPGNTHEIGMLEMGWIFVEGEKYRIRADGYKTTVEGTVW